MPSRGAGLSFPQSSTTSHPFINLAFGSVEIRLRDMSNESQYAPASRSLHGFGPDGQSRANDPRMRPAGYPRGSSGLPPRRYSLRYILCLCLRCESSVICFLRVRYRDHLLTVSLQSKCDSTNRQFSYWSSSLSLCYCSSNGPRISQLQPSAVTVARSSSAPLCPAFQFHVCQFGDCMLSHSETI